MDQDLKDRLIILALTVYGFGLLLLYPYFMTDESVFLPLFPFAAAGAIVYRMPTPEKALGEDEMNSWGSK